MAAMEMTMAAAFTASTKSDALATVPGWWTACLRGYKLVSHAEQVPQNIWCDPG